MVYFNENMEWGLILLDIKLGYSFEI